MKTRDVVGVIAMAVGMILLLILACWLIVQIVEQTGKHEDQAHQEPFQQEVPFKKCA